MTTVKTARGHWPTALIFDLDGTLVDSAPDIAAAVQRALADHDIAIDSAEIRDYIGDGAARLIERVLAARDIVADPAALAGYVDDFNAHYHAAPAAHTQCYPGAREMLTQARARGHRLGICTNKPQPVAERVLAELGLAAQIDVLIGAGTYALKPDPAPLLACLSALDADRNTTLYVGDMAVDRDVARAAGLPVVLVSFGYAHADVSEFAPEAVLHHWYDWPDVCQRLADARTAEGL